jgi:hypothetical protein
MCVPCLVQALEIGPLRALCVSLRAPQGALVPAKNTITYRLQDTGTVRRSQGDYKGEHCPFVRRRRVVVRASEGVKTAQNGPPSPHGREDFFCACVW